MFERKITKEITAELCWVPADQRRGLGFETATAAGLRAVGLVEDKEAAERLAWFAEHFEPMRAKAASAEHEIKRVVTQHTEEMRRANETIGKLTRELERERSK